jgi:hypothetical protein
MLRDREAIVSKHEGGLAGGKPHETGRIQKPLPKNFPCNSSGLTPKHPGDNV